jgi:hypothetical protein
MGSYHGINRRNCVKKAVYSNLLNVFVNIAVNTNLSGVLDDVAKVIAALLVRVLGLVDTTRRPELLHVCTLTVSHETLTK